MPRVWQASMIICLVSSSVGRPACKRAVSHKKENAHWS
jgi:hypothetical protein